MIILNIGQVGGAGEAKPQKINSDPQVQKAKDAASLDKVLLQGIVPNNVVTNDVTTQGVLEDGEWLYNQLLDFGVLKFLSPKDKEEVYNAIIPKVEDLYSSGYQKAAKFRSLYSAVTNAIGEFGGVDKADYMQKFAEWGDHILKNVYDANPIDFSDNGEGGEPPWTNFSEHLIDALTSVHEGLSFEVAQQEINPRLVTIFSEDATNLQKELAYNALVSFINAHHGYGFIDNKNDDYVFDPDRSEDIFDNCHIFRLKAMLADQYNQQIGE